MDADELHDEIFWKLTCAITYILGEADEDQHDAIIAFVDRPELGPNLAEELRETARMMRD